MKVALVVYQILAGYSLCSSNQADKEKNKSSLHLIHDVIFMLIMVLFAYAGMIFHQFYLRGNKHSAPNQYDYRGRDTRKLDDQTIDNQSSDSLWEVPDSK